MGTEGLYHFVWLIHASYYIYFLICTRMLLLVILICCIKWLTSGTDLRAEIGFTQFLHFIFVIMHDLWKFIRGGHGCYDAHSLELHQGSGHSKCLLPPVYALHCYIPQFFTLIFPLFEILTLSFHCTRRPSFHTHNMALLVYIILCSPIHSRLPNQLRVPYLTTSYIL